MSSTSSSTPTPPTTDQFDKTPPPSSFYILTQQSTTAITSALAQSHTLLEVEFPPLPSSVLEMDDVSAYDVSRANIKLASETATELIKMHGFSNIAIMVPDEAELDIARESTLTSLFKGVTINALRNNNNNNNNDAKPANEFMKLFAGAFGAKGDVTGVPGADMYVVVTASAQELPDVETLHLLDPKIPIIFFNMKLDTLRGDLGIPAFPGKDLHDRFLSRVKPAYYLRTRQYSRTTTTPPFVVNYQGCLFRVFPGKYQCLLDVGDGNFRRVQNLERRPGLGEFKGLLNDELVAKGVVQDEGSVFNFLRTGYKTRTWWEEDREEANEGWRY